MSREQIKAAFEAAGYASEELANQGYELYKLKEEGKNLPDTKEALETFTQNWANFCVTNTQWHTADQLGYRIGLWR